MSRIAPRSLSLVLTIAVSLVAPTLASPLRARAQSTGTVTREADTGTAGSGSSGGSGSGSGASQLGDEQALLEEREAPPAQRSGFEPGEVEGETYIFAGVLARALIIPSYPFEIANQVTYDFQVPINGAGGVYFNYRRNAFNVQLEVYYQGMEWEGFVRDRGDPDSETEYIRSRLGVVFGYVGFGWAFDIAEWFAIELGFGLGIGGLVGDLFRQEATRDASGHWQACTGPSTTPDAYCESPVEMPNPSNGRLDDDRIHGGTYQFRTGPNPFYFGPGGVPPMFATLDLPRLSFRFKPIHQIQIRIDTAFNVYGISLGASLGYGF